MNYENVWSLVSQQMKVNWTRPCSDHFSLSACVFTEMLKFVGHLQDVEIVEDGAKHTLVLYNCKIPQTGEVAFTAANAKCSANLKVKGELSLPHSTFLCKVLTHFPSTAMCLWFSLKMKSLSTLVFFLLHFLLLNLIILPFHCKLFLILLFECCNIKNNSKNIWIICIM